MTSYIHYTSTPVHVDASHRAFSPIPVIIFDYLTHVVIPPLLQCLLDIFTLCSSVCILLFSASVILHWASVLLDSSSLHANSLVFILEGLLCLLCLHLSLKPAPRPFVPFHHVESRNI